MTGLALMLCVVTGCFSDTRYKQGTGDKPSQVTSINSGPLIGSQGLVTRIDTRTVQSKVFETSDLPQALVLSVHGKCEFSTNHTSFAVLKAGQVFLEGAVIRTGEGARADLFFRRIGTTVRLQADTEIGLAKMTRIMNGSTPVFETLLDVRAGRIFTVVRSLVAGSTLEIKNAAGRAVVEGGGGKGRYIITADGTHVTDKNSAVPLKVIGETGVTIITPGQRFSAKDGKVFSLNPSDAVQELIHFDELDALTEQLMPPEK